MNELYDLVIDIRKSLVEKRTGRSNPSETFIRDNLIGSCVENAEYLSKQLSAKGYTTKIIKGGVDLPNEPTPQSYTEAEKIGVVHHWVEVQYNGSTFFVNLVKEGPKITSEPLVSRDLPLAYIEF